MKPRLRGFADLGWISNRQKTLSHVPKRFSINFGEMKLIIGQNVPRLKKMSPYRTNISKSVLLTSEWTFLSTRLPKSEPNHAFYWYISFILHFGETRSKRCILVNYVVETHPLILVVKKST